MDALAAIETLGLFGTGLSQHARLITLASAQDRALPKSLMPELFTGREAVNELFVFDVDALSVSTNLDLSVFIGEELTIELLQPDGKRRKRRTAHGRPLGVACRARSKKERKFSVAALRHRRSDDIGQHNHLQKREMAHNRAWLGQRLINPNA